MTTSLQAEFVGSALKRLLRAKPRLTGHVCNVYTYAVNVVFDGRFSCSIISSGVGRSAHSVVISSVQGLNVVAGTPAELTSESLYIGNVDIRLSHARIWPDGNKLNVSNNCHGLAINAKALRECLIKARLRDLCEISTVCFQEETNQEQRGKWFGLGDLALFEPSSLRSSEFNKTGSVSKIARIALPSAASLIDACYLADWRRVQEACFNLIGFGPGLTPSGDDFLAAWFFTVISGTSRTTRQATVKSLLRNVCSQARGITTMAGQTLLSEVYWLEPPEVIFQLTDAVLNAGPEDVANTALNTLNVGGSSGVDMAVGVLFGLYALVHI